MCVPTLVSGTPTSSPAPNQLYGHVTSNRTVTVGSPGPTYEIIGDLTIDPGVTLTIERGVTLRMTPFSDFIASGLDRGRVEMVVQGELLVPAGSGSVFLLCNSQRGWQGVRVPSGGSASLSDCTVAQSMYGALVESGGTLNATRCSFEQLSDGLIFVPGSSGSLSGCAISGPGILPGSVGLRLPFSLTSSDSLAPQPNTLNGFETGISIDAPGITIARVLVRSCYFGVIVDEPDVTLNYCSIVNAEGSAVVIGNFPTTRIFNDILTGQHPISSTASAVFCNYTDAYGGFGLGDPFGGVQLGNRNASFDPFFAPDFSLNPASLFTNYSVSGGQIGAYGPGAVLPTPILSATVVNAGGSGGVVNVRWFSEARGSSKAGVFRRTEDSDWQPLTVLYPDGLGYVTLVDRDVEPGERYEYGVGVQHNGQVGIEGTVWVTVEAPISGLAVESIQPNPATTAWSVGFLSPEAADSRVEVVDLSGRVVRALALGPIAIGSQTVSVTAQGLPPGVYWIRVRQGGHAALAKAVKSN
jgi:hypothetical protein